MAEHWALPEIDLAACTRCGQCVTQCPTQVVEMQVVGPVIIRPAGCTYCTVCEAVCPVGAIACAFEIAWDIHTAG